MRRLANKTNVIAPNDDFPFGRAKDNPGNRTGTPVDENLLGDMLQLLEKMFEESGILANEQADSDYTGFQLYDALLQNISDRIGKRFTGSTDLNDEKRPGNYIVTTTNANRPSGMTANSLMVVSGSLLPDGTGTLRQTITDAFHSAVWMRTLTGPSTWGSWVVVRLAQQTIDIGSWNMQAAGGGTQTVDVPIPVDINPQNIRTWAGSIRGDLTNSRHHIGMASLAGAMELWFSGYTVGAATFTVVRLTGGTFDDAAYNDPVINRGWIVVTYDPTTTPV